MAFIGFSDDATRFYEGLEADNSKAYWTDNRALWEREVREPLLALLEELAAEFGDAHVFRPYRDVRFSADKSPYKTGAGAHTERGGYVELSARGLFVASGYWRTASDQVARLRAGVADDRAGTRLAAVVKTLEAAGYQIGGQTLKTVPRGYDREHPRSELLRYKTLTVSRDLGAPDWLATPAAREQVAAAWREMNPLRVWLDTHVGPSREPARPGRR
jgi:uncharacterized protein (TIGR02453 family)